MIHAFQSAVSYLCFAVLAVIACVCFFVGFRQVGRWLRANLCPVSLVVFATAAVIATCEAQKRGGEGGSGTSAQPIVQPLPGAETNVKWRVHGAFEDVFYLSASNWWARMPGGGWVDRLRIRSFGGFQAKGALGGSWANYQPPFAQKFSLAPEVNWSLPSLFWHATTPSNTLVMTWLGGLYARSHTNQVDFQVELFNDGSYDYRYADRTEHFAASLPFDLDGDGLENSVDPDPLTSGPDAHGTNAEWYNTVCSNVLEAVGQIENGGWGMENVTWRGGVNSNAYYFVDVVVERGPAPIYFTGDRETRLGNPVVVARAFETNRVPLLIGVDYSITSDTPFTVSYPMEYMYPEVKTNEPCRAHIRWPLNFVFTESIGVSNRVYTVTVEPYDPGGVFEWGDSGGGVPMRGGSSGGCNCVSYGVNSVWFSCSSTCTCESGCSAHGSYLLEATSFSIDGGECRCGYDDPPPDDYNPDAPPPHEPDDPPSLAITFSKQAVIFENAYEDFPGVSVPRHSTRVRLTIDAYGGMRGGMLSLSEENMGNLIAVGGGLSFPYSQQLAAGESYHMTGVYEGRMASGSANDVSVYGSITEHMTAQQFSARNEMTVVRIEIKEDATAIGNPYIHRRSYGIAENVKCLQFPPTPVVQWRTTGMGTFENSVTKKFSCPILAETSCLYAEVSSASLPIFLNVIEPERIVCDYAEFLPPSANGLGCGMLLYLLVAPFHVSFSHLEMEEIPADLSNWQQWGSHSGYFSDPSYYQLWCHTTRWGAGKWVPIDEFNSMGFDASRMLTWLQPWSAGTLSWTIPYGWRRKDSISVTPAGQINPPSYSVWTMSANFLEKQKHSHRIGVSADGRTYFEGNLRNGNQ